MVRIAARLRLILLAAMVLVVPVAGHAATPEIRELQRKLFVLHALDGLDIDGNDTPRLRERLRTVLAEQRSTAVGDAAIDAALGDVIRARQAEALSPFPEPQPFDRPAFSSGWISGLAVLPKDNLVLAGHCTQIARYRLDSGLPLKPLGADGIGQIFASNPARGEIVCASSWDGKRYGLLILDARTGLRKDFIIVPGLTMEIFLRLKIETSGRTGWVFSKTGIVAVNFETRQTRVLARDFPPLLVEGLDISADGTMLAAEFARTGGKGFPHEIRFYDTASGRLVSTVAGSEGLLMSPSGAVYLAKKGDRLEVRAVRGGQLIAARKFDADAPVVEQHSRAVVFSGRDQSILFITQQETDRAFWRWDLAASTLTKLFAFKPTGNETWIDDAAGAVYTIGGDGVFAYDINTGKPRSSMGAVERVDLVGAAISPGGTQAVVVRNGDLRSVDLASGQVRQIAELDLTLDDEKDLFVQSAKLGFADETSVVLGGADGRIVKVETTTGKTTTVATLPDLSIARLVVSRNGQYVAMHGTTYANSKLVYHLRVVALSTGQVVYRKATPQVLHAIGFADNDRRVVFGEQWAFTAVDLASGQTVLREEIKTNIRKSGTLTQWNWGRVNWILPPRVAGGPVLVGVDGSVYGLVYEYAAGRLTIRHGSTSAGERSGWLLGQMRAIAMAEDGTYIAVHGNTPKTGRPPESAWISQHAAVEGAPLAVGPMRNGRFAVVTNTGTIATYDMRQPDPLVVTVLGSGGNWLSRIKGGYFAGTRGAAENLFLAVSSDETITIDSLFDTLYRPDLVAALGAGEPQGGRLLESAPKTDIGTLLKDGLPPRAAILSPAAGATAVAETQTVRAELTVAAGGLGRVEWRVNGVTRIAETPAEAGGARPGDIVPIETSLLLEPGANEVEVVAYNAVNRIASTPARIDVTFGKPGTVAEPRLFVLSIGVNEYWDSRLKLNYAAPDAVDVAHSFETAGKGLFQDVQTWVVTDSRATRSGIKAAFDDIARKIRTTDVFILFVAGHGKTEEGRYYFLPHDLNYQGPSSIAEQGIGQGDWQGWLSQVAARKSLLMFDTCESGTLALDKVTRGFDRVAALDRLTRATGRSVLAAASDDGPALEGFLGHGVFAYAVLEGLGVADPNRTGLVQVTALASYIGQRVPELSFGKFGIRQVPQMKLTGEDFSIGRAIASLEKVDEDFVPSQPTHVLIAQSKLMDADGRELPVDVLPAGTLLRVVSTTGSGLSEVARAGKKLGYVSAQQLVPMQ